MSNDSRGTASRRGFSAAGAVFCAMSVALSAYAAHALEGAAQTRMQTATLHLFLHGLALVLFAPRQGRRIERLALWGWLVGSVLFSGSIASAVLFGTSARLAPFGGGFLILGWLLQAGASLRR